MKEYFIYLLIVVLSTYLIRALPFAAVRGRIRSVRVRSFLHYIPYTVLAAMTLPAALYATGSVLSAAVGLAVGALLAYRTGNLTLVAIVTSLGALICELLMMLL